MEKVKRKRKTDRDLYVVEVVEVDTTRKQLKIHFVGFSREYDEWRDYDNTSSNHRSMSAFEFSKLQISFCVVKHYFKIMN